MKKLAITSEFAFRLDSLMQKKGTTIKELAKVLCCSEDTIYKWKRKASDFVPADHYIKKLSDFFKVDYAYLSLAQDCEHKPDATEYSPDSIEYFILSNSHFLDFLSKMKDYYNSLNGYHKIVLDLPKDTDFSVFDYREIYKNKAKAALDALFDDLCKWDPVVNKSLSRLIEICSGIILSEQKEPSIELISDCIDRLAKCYQDSPEDKTGLFCSSMVRPRNQIENISEDSEIPFK